MTVIAPGKDPAQFSHDDGREIGALSTEDLESQICELAAHIAAAEARFVALVAEYDQRGGWAGWECHSCAHWLEWKCALSPGAARERVRVARTMRNLPAIYAEFARGRLSYSQVRALTRVATAENEVELIALATQMTASQLEDAVRSMRGVISNEAGLARERQRSATYYYDETGCAVFKIRVNPEEGALVLTALEAIVADLANEAEIAAASEVTAASQVPTASQVAAASEVPTETHSIERPTRAQLRADAFVRMAQASSRQSELPVWQRDQRHVVIHADVAALTDGTGNAFLQGGPSISAASLEKITCDATITAIYEMSPGEVVAMGRTTRQATERQRRALLVRDTHCQFPGCRNTRFLKVHHLWHWSKGGPTDLWNLVLVCSFHHDAIHERGLALARSPEGRIIARTAGGHLLSAVARLRGVASDPDRVVTFNRARGIKIDDETVTPLWDGSTYRQAREALVALIPPAARR